MTIIQKSLQYLMMLALPCGMALAASNPIQWTLNQSLPEVVLAPGGTYVAVYTFTNALPFTLAKPLVIEKTSNSPSEYAYDDLCTGKKLARSETCTVTIYFNPVTVGTKTVYLTQVYGNDRVPLPMLSSLASSTSGGTEMNGVVLTALPSTLDVNASAPWEFTFTNTGVATATSLNLTVSGAAYSTSCTFELDSNTPCYVRGNYTASATGSQTISATLSYAQGAPVTVSTTTNGSGASGGLICTAAVPLAPETLINTSNPVTLLCTNKTGANITITGHTPVYPGSFTVASGGDNCTAGTLSNGAACQLKGTYVAPGTSQSNVVISLSVNYDTPSTSGLTSSASTNTDVVTVINNYRTINLVNHCNFNVWWSMVGGALTNSPACTSNSDCPTGSTCNTSAKLCYYNNYGASTGGYQLNANGGVATTQVIETSASDQAGDDILWKGLISASTQCTPGASCLNNDCSSNGGTTSCAAGVGFNQPATEAEFTFLLIGSGNTDSYDISNVNGFSIPISMSTNQAADVYTCGNAGNSAAVAPLAACNYNVAPPTNMYYWVTNTGTACTAQNTCSNSLQICGLAFSASANTFVKNCGDFLGYWAANQICQTTPAFSSPFGDNFTCSQYLSTPFSPPSHYTLTQLLKCSPPSSTEPQFNSCYLSYPSATTTELAQCCGCTDWSNIAYPSQQCPQNQTDPQWTSYVLPLIQWMKQACPTSYVYPYDDKASSFTCASSSSTEYTITFCPGGSGMSGLPAGKTDGR